MQNLTSHESIDIKASPERVWEVLTKLSYMKQWSELSITFAGEQELHKGAKVLWIDDDGEAYATGAITDFEPHTKLRVSPKFSSWDEPVSPDDIASVFTLHKQDDGTHLEFSYGDFAKVPDGESLWQSYVDSITPVNKELEKIKVLAEKQE